MNKKREQYVVSVWVNKEMMDQIDTIATDEARSRSQVCQRIFKLFLDNQEKENDQ